MCIRPICNSMSTFLQWFLKAYCTLAKQAKTAFAVQRVQVCPFAVLDLEIRINTDRLMVLLVA